MVDYHHLWRVFERFATTLVDRQHLGRVLEAFGPDISVVLGVAGAGIMLEDDHGDLRFHSASDATLGILEALQIDLGEGPCLLAYRAGERVIASDLATDARFPRFGPAAAEAGMGAVYSFPMMLDEKIIGAINLYDEEAAELDREQIEIGETLAKVATIYMQHAWEFEDLQGLNEQLQHALHSRVVVEQAKGYLAAHNGRNLEGAREALRAYARPRQLKLQELARQVLAGEVSPEQILGEG